MYPRRHTGKKVGTYGRCRATADFQQFRRESISLNLNFSHRTEQLLG
jgi:hypothetical protein